MKQQNLQKLATHKECTHGLSVGDTTKLVKSYNTSPKLYDYFCQAEDIGGVVANYLKKFCNPQKTVMLDIGCGTGKYVNILSRYCKKVLGVEPVEPQLQFAREATKRLKIFNVGYMQGSGEKIPCRNKYADLIIATWVTMCKQCSFQEMKRVLKKDGIIVRVSPCKKDDLTSLFPKLNVEKMKNNNKWFTDHGFKTKHHKLIIQFSNLGKSGNILSKVIGAKKNKIHKRVLEHCVVIQTYDSGKN